MSDKIKRVAIDDEVLEAVNGGYLKYIQDDWGKGEIWIYHLIDGQEVDTKYRWSFTDGASVKAIVDNRGTKTDSQLIAELGDLITKMY